MSLTETGEKKRLFGRAASNAQGKANLSNTRRRAKPARYKEECEDRVGVMAMARILGILPVTMSYLGRDGRLPSTCTQGIRYFNVDEVLEKAPRLGLSLPPLKVKQKTHMQDSEWAWDALSMGPKNCKRAPSGRAWRLYLDGRRDPFIRRSLVRAHTVLANRQLRQIGDWTAEPDPTEELEGSQPKAPGSDSATPEEPKKLSPGELCLQQLEAGYLDGPLAVKPPDEPVPGSVETDY